MREEQRQQALAGLRSASAERRAVARVEALNASGVSGRGRGRPALAECLDQAAADALRRKAVKCGSLALALEWFRDDPRCPDPLRDWVDEHTERPEPWTAPLSIRRAARVTPELAAWYRGPRAFGQIAFKCRHCGVVVDPATGEPRPLRAGDLYISDDMSVNHPFWFALPDGEASREASPGECSGARPGRDSDPLARRHGVGVGRQGLYTMDAATGKWLGVDLIGRAREAYTSADILRHFRHILAEHGLPRCGWVLEQGVWCARTVDGVRVAVVGDEARLEVVAGLSSLGFAVEHVHTAEGKALIEGGFKLLQQILDLQEETPTIGHKRGEMERETRMMRSVQEGARHPAEAGLAHIERARERVVRAQVFANSRHKRGQIQKGVPDERWAQDLAGEPLRPLAPEHLGVFLPAKTATRIRQGCVEATIERRRFRFSNPELFARLGAGYRLLVAWDPTDPAPGAECYNLESGARNVLGAKAGAWLAHAEYEAERPLWGYTDETAQGQARKRRHTRAFVAAYGGTGLFGRGGGRISEARDGDGNVVAREMGMRPGSASSPEAEMGGAGADLGRGQRMRPGAAPSPAAVRRELRGERDLEALERWEKSQRLAGV